MADQLSSDLASLKIQRDVHPDRGSWLRTVLVVALVGGVSAAGYLFAYPRLKAEVFKTEVTITEVALVSPAQASITVTSTGYVVPQKITKVGSKLPGRLSKVNVKEGDVVKEGDIVAEIESADQKSAVTSAGARVAAAKARAEAARANLDEVKQQMEREKTLVEKGVTGRAALDDLTARSKSLERAVGASDADVRAAQTEVDSLKVSLSSTAIRAPMNGTVISKPAEVGEIVGALELAPLFELADLDSMRVETDVPEGRLHLVRIGAPAEIVLDAYPSKRFRGAAEEIGKRVNRAKGTVMVKVKFTDPMEGVLPEMSARVSFLAEALSAEAMKEPPKRVIPAAAVVDRSGAKLVFVVDEGKVRMTPVTLGPAVGSGLELVEGPPPGTRLVASPPPEMKDGQKIKEKTGNGE